MIRMLTLTLGTMAFLAASAQTQPPPFYPDKTNLLVLRDDAKDVPVRTPADWEKRRAHILANMELVMGPMPKLEKPPLDLQITEAVKMPKFTRKLVTFQSSPGNHSRADVK